MTLFERILNENKDHLVNKLSSLSDHEKNLVIGFLHNHPNYESKIDWNKKDIQFNEFEKIFSENEQSKSRVKSKVKSGNLQAIWDARKENDFKVLKITDDEIYVAPLSWECAQFMNSFDCYGIGAKWCIGYSKSISHWVDYVLDRDYIFIFKFNRAKKQKLMFQIDYQDAGRFEFQVWNANDSKIGSSNDSGNKDWLQPIVGLTYDEMIPLVEETAKLYDEMKHEDEIFNGIQFYDAAKKVINTDIYDTIKEMVETLEIDPRKDKYYDLAEPYIIEKTCKLLGLGHDVLTVQKIKRMKSPYPESGNKTMIELLNHEFKKMIANNF
jgi:hypothetical protein